MTRVSLALAFVAVLAAALVLWFTTTGPRRQALDAVDTAATKSGSPTELTAAADDAAGRTEAAPSASTASDEASTVSPTSEPDQAGSPGAAPITGVVVDGEGLPLERVHVFSRVDLSTGRGDWDDTPARGRTQELVETDADGRFELRSWGPWRVAVTAHAEGRSSATVPGCPPGAELRLVLLEQATLEGIVSAQDLPVAGALVRVHHGPEQEVLSTATTDAAGRFRLEGLRASTAGLIVAPREHSMSRWREVELLEGRTTHVEVEVESGWAVGGRVVDRRTNDPIAGASVSAWDFIGKNTGTDEQGRFRIAGVKERPGTLVARAPGYGRTELRFDAPREDLELALVPGRRVVGQIRATDDPGTLLSGSIVIAALESEGRLSRREWQRVEFEHDGRFEFDCVRSDMALAVQVRSPGYGAVVVAVPDPVDGTSTVPDIVLTRHSILAGVVRHPDGTAAEGAAIQLTGPSEADLDHGAAFHFGTLRDTTDERGRFYLPGLVAGTYQLSAHVPAGRALQTEITLAPGEQRLDLELRLPGGTTFGGRVADAERRGVAGALVMLFPENREPGPLLADETDDAGNFEIPDVPEGKFLARVSAPDPESESDARYVPSVFEGLEADGALVELTLDRLDAVVLGRAVDAQGQAVEGVYVCVSLGAFEVPWNGVLTDSEGAFELPVRSVGSTDLVAWRTEKLDDSKTPTGTEWQLGRDLLDEDGPAARASIEAGTSEVVLEVR